MAVPKRKTTPSKRDKRRTHHNLSPCLAMSTCKVCGEVIRRHYACEFCAKKPKAE